ncbi:F0F1 ATP synthase subunit delta [Pseudogemmobacter faecipullorum]|uniref:ATP synthase subunit delta n=1 Tax=Pseudogemmobacter faecipullorum TaxID=2755041 RepID=A0ABS8CIE3_9RHOB|nr:F0F1 ATP synthase subunit delta [Pseudogemmobacter faecipullorum]
MAESASISQGIAARYASALFDLAKEGGALSAIEADAAQLKDALAASPELNAMIASPVVVRADQANAIQALASAMKLSDLTANTLALMAAKRRLFVLPQLLAALADLIAEEKGEISVEVVAASALSPAQAKALSDKLKASVGKEVKLNTTVDESLIGGLIVKLGSIQIDTSVKSKLASLQNAMKEVG